MGYSKLGRNSSARKALFRSVLVSLFKHERIETTEAKAKEISGLAEKLITLAKRDDLSARRQVIAELVDKEVAKKLFDYLFCNIFLLPLQNYPYYNHRLLLPQYYV